MNRFYDKKLLFRCLFMFCVTLAVVNVSHGAAFAVIFPFAMVALSRNKPEEFVFYILMMITMVTINPVIAPKGAVFFIEQRGMIAILGFLLTVKIAGQRTWPVLKPFMFMIVYILFMVIPSCTGWLPIVSLLKLFLFSVVYYALYCSTNMLASSSRSEIESLRSVMLSIAIPFILGSVVLIFFPAIGMMSYEEFILNGYTEGSLFRGFTNHAQCLGPVIACLGTLLFADFLFGIGRPDKLYLLMLICCPILIWKTSSRTALGTMLAGIAFVMYFFMRARYINQKWKSKIIGSVLIVAALGSIALIFSGAGEGVKRFIAKRDAGEGRVELSAESVLSSRMGLAEGAMANFRKKPLCGNGFQVSEELSYRDTSHWTSLLSAPVEKGVWVTAILEEGGAVGLSLFIIFLLATFSTMIRNRAFTGASTLFVLVVSNFGEFSMFSMSYSGGFCWAMVFAALVLDSARIKREIAIRSYMTMGRM